MITKYGKGWIDSHGYIIVDVKGRSQYLHRLIFEDTHKLTLLSSAIIHHKDKNKLNNSVNNLEMMSKSEHNTVHHKDKINSEDTLKKMSNSKMKKNNPQYGTGASGYYRVYKAKKPTCKQGFTWVYEYPEERKKKTISRVNLKDLEKVVRNKNLDWHKIGDD